MVLEKTLSAVNFILLLLYSALNDRMESSLCFGYIYRRETHNI